MTPLDIRSKVRLNNDSKAIASDWWSWRMWVEGPDQALDQIGSVKYTLHHTFPDPVRVVRDRSSRFALESAGWGEFTVRALVSTTSGDSFHLERWLRLGDPEGTAPGGEERHPRLFLSHSVTDRSIVHLLTRELATQGVELVTPESAPSISLAESLLDSIQSADIVVVLTSSELRPFAETEIRTAEKLGKPVISIVLGGGSAPEQLKHSSLLRLGDYDQLGAIADALAARTKDAFFADES